MGTFTHPYSTPPPDKLALEQRNSNASAFRRIQYILYDFKYLLGVKPEVGASRSSSTI